MTNGYDDKTPDDRTDTDDCHSYSRFGKRAVAACLFLILPFFGGIATCIALLALGYNGGWAALAVGAGIFPSISYSLYVKFSERRAFKKIDIKDYDRKTGVVSSCEISSYKTGARSYVCDPAPSMYRIKVKVDDKTYTVYGTERYGVGETCSLYIKRDGGFAQIVGRGDGVPSVDSEQALFKQLTAEEDAFFDDLYYKCDDYTYDLLYDAWADEWDGADREKLSASEKQQARYEASVKFHKLIIECYDEYGGDKASGAQITITRDRLKRFSDGYDAGKTDRVAVGTTPVDGAAAEATVGHADGQQADVTVTETSGADGAAQRSVAEPVKDRVGAPRYEVGADPVARTGDRESGDEQLSDGSHDGMSEMPRSGKRPTVGYKGIGRKKR